MAFGSRVSVRGLFPSPCSDREQTRSPKDRQFNFYWDSFPSKHISHPSHQSGLSLRADSLFPGVPFPALTLQSLPCVPIPCSPFSFLSPLPTPPPQQAQTDLQRTPLVTPLTTSVLFGRVVSWGLRASSLVPRGGVRGEVGLRQGQAFLCSFSVLLPPSRLPLLTSCLALL